MEIGCGLWTRAADALSEAYVVLKPFDTERDG